MKGKSWQSEKMSKAAAVSCSSSLAIICIFASLYCQLLHIYQYIHVATGLLQHPSGVTHSALV